MRLIILLSLVLVTLCSFYMNEARQPYPYLGQQCPPDMEFIPGNDHIPSFFIGKSQETNMDYLIYLSWLDRVFKDYPDVLNRLQPHEFVDDSLSQFNDPYLKPQLRNPAFAYYPVVGLDWWQIQQYLAWKTDRINESILIENDFFDYNPEIDHREDNFNTEAFLEGKVRQLINKPNALKYYFNSREKNYDDYKGKSALSDRYPILFSGLRLPTEEEWEYAAQDQFQNEVLEENRKHPFGDNFYLRRFIWSPHTYIKGGHIYQPHFLIGYFNNAVPVVRKDLNSMKNAGTYHAESYGIYNMGNNVKEWMMDLYSDTKKRYSSPESIYTQNGFNLSDQVYERDPDGDRLDRDSLGRMRYRNMGVKRGGDDLNVKQPHFITKYSPVLEYDSIELKLIGILQLLELRNQLPKIWRTNVGRSDTVGIDFIKKYYSGRDHFYQSDGFLTYANSDVFYHSFSLKPYVKFKEIGNDSMRFICSFDTLAILKNRTYMAIHNEPYFRKASRIDTLGFYRVIKTGTWKNPSKTARSKMRETDASGEVGFRCVMSYNGLPIDKKYIVNWKKVAKKAVVKKRKYGRPRN